MQLQHSGEEVINIKKGIIRFGFLSTAPPRTSAASDHVEKKESPQ